MKIKFFLVILFCVILLSACQSKQTILFPVEREDTHPLNEAKHSSSVGFDFYIQSTPSMEGFVSISLTQRESSFYKAIPLLYTASLSSVWSAANVTSTNFYRFDVKQDDRFAFKISDEEFKVTSLLNPNNQESNFYNPAFYSDAGVTQITNEYLAPVIDELNEENISVIVTDMVDYNARTDNVAKALCKIIDDGLSIGLFGIMSNFDGEIFIGDTGYEYGGAFRPFYILIIGRDVDVYEYSKSLKKYFDDPDKEIDYNFEFISASQLHGVTTSKDLNKEMFSLQGVTEVFETQLIGTEAEMFGEGNGYLYYQLSNYKKIPYNWLSFKAPIKLKFEQDTNLSLKTDFILERLVAVDSASSGRSIEGKLEEMTSEKKDSILCITTPADSQGFEDEILTTSASDISSSGEYDINIIFNKNELKENGIKNEVKYKLTVKTYTSFEDNSFTTPQWIKDFSYNKRIDQYYRDLVDSAEREGDRAGQFTLGLREIIDPVLNTVQILQNNTLVSDFSFYFKY